MLCRLSLAALHLLSIYPHLVRLVDRRDARLAASTPRKQRDSRNAYSQQILHQGCISMLRSAGNELSTC